MSTFSALDLHRRYCNEESSSKWDSMLQPSCAVHALDTVVSHVLLGHAMDLQNVLKLSAYCQSGDRVSGGMESSKLESKSLDECATP